MASKTLSWKIMGVTVSLRLMVIVVALLSITYMAASNWQWYENDLGGTIKHPQWASPTSNWIIWLIYFGITLFIWNKHQIAHPEMVKMDLYYPISLILTFIFFTLFFEQRQLGAAKWFGLLNVIVVAYMIFSEFLREPVLSVLLTINFAIMLYTVCQLWYYSKNEKYLLDSGLSKTMYGHITSQN